MSEVFIQIGNDTYGKQYAKLINRFSNIKGGPLPPAPRPFPVPPAARSHLDVLKHLIGLAFM